MNLIFSQRMLRGWPYYASVLLVAFVIVGAQVYTKPIRTPAADEFVYLQISSDLITAGTFSDGPFAKDRTRPGRFFSPLYPAFLWMVAGLDEQSAQAIRCYGKTTKEQSCTGNFQSIVMIQVALAAISLLFVFIMAKILSGSILAAWLAMLIAAATGEFGYFARTYLTENLAFFSFYGLLLFLIVGYQTNKARHWLLAGLFAGLAVLSRPSYAYLFYLLIPALFSLVFWVNKHPFAHAARMAGLFALAGGLVLAPWAIRNLVQFGDMALTQGYGPFILVQRLAYNLMSWQEWAVSFIYWLPGFGDSWGEALFPQRLWEKLNFFYGDVQTYYVIGNGAWGDQLLADAGPPGQQTGYLIRTYILGDLFKHVMVSIPLSLRGIWVGNYLSLIGVALAWPVGIWMMRMKRFTLYLLFVLPPLFMAGLHGFISVNVDRYNIPLIAVFAVILSIFIRWLIEFYPPAARLAARLEGKTQL